MGGQISDTFLAHPDGMTSHDDAAEVGAAGAAALREMLKLLSTEAPGTPSDALRLLRDGFPAVPLETRVAACAEFTRRRTYHS